MVALALVLASAAEPVRVIPDLGPGLRPVAADTLITDDGATTPSTAELHFGASWIRVRPTKSGAEITAGSGETVQMTTSVSPAADLPARFAVGQPLSHDGEILVAVEVGTAFLGRESRTELVVVGLPAKAGVGEARLVGRTGASFYMDGNSGTFTAGRVDIHPTPNGLITVSVEDGVGASYQKVPGLKALEQLPICDPRDDRKDYATQEQWIVRSCAGIPSTDAWTNTSACPIQAVVGLSHNAAPPSDHSADLVCGSARPDWLP